MTEGLLDLLPSWELSLRAERKSPHTIKAYTDGIKGFVRWCVDTHRPVELTKSTVQEFLANIPNSETAIARRKALKRYAAWLVEEGEVVSDPLLGVKRPKLDRKVVQGLDDDQVRLLIKSCQGKAFQDRRDEALVRLMVETGLRAGEVLSLEVSDVDLVKGLLIVRRGNGAKGRVVAFGPQTAAAIDRYQRMRRTHRLAGTPVFWLGVGGKGFGYYALAATLKDRAHLAGLSGFHLHKMRHTAATRWLRSGGSEGGLMTMAGWSTRDMIDRYTGASAGERAAAEARRLNLGEW